MAGRTRVLASYLLSFARSVEVKAGKLSGGMFIAKSTLALGKVHLKNQ